MSTTTTTTTTSHAALPSVKVTKPFARTTSASTRSKIIPKTKPVPVISSSSSSTGATSTSNGVTSTDGESDSKSKTATAQPTQGTNAPIKARLPSSAPFDMKKIRAFITERPDLRKTSTSTVGSTNSTSSIMSKASTISTASSSSFDTGSIASTETVRPKAKVSAKSKVFPITAPTLASASASQLTKKVPLPVKKVAITVKKPAPRLEKIHSAESDAADRAQDKKQVKVPKLVSKLSTKKVVKKKPKQPSEPVDRQPDTTSAVTVKIPASKPLKAGQSKTTTTTTKLEVKHNSIPKLPMSQTSETQADPSSKDAIQPSRKKTIVPTTSAASETAAPMPARKKPKLASMKNTASTQAQLDTISSVQPAVSFPKSCLTKSVNTTQQKTKSATGSTRLVDPNMTPAKAAARCAVSASIPLITALSRSQKNEVQIPPTPKSSRTSRTKHISTTPLPSKLQQPRIEAPLTRRKSVSFKSPLEAFQIIPARRPSRSPPRSASKKVTMAPFPTKRAMPTIKEHEMRPPTPFVPPPSDEDDDNDVVFQYQEDPNDRVALGLPIPAKDVIPKKPAEEQPDPEQLPEAILIDDGNFDEQRDIQLTEATPATSELTVDKSDEAQTLNEMPPPPPPPAAVETPAIAEAETQSEIEAFDPEIPDNEDDEEDDDDESTVFYDADESYIPQYSSPRKPGTPRSKIGTPLGSLTIKLVKSPRLVTENGSPKLDLLRLCSPTKKRKVKKAVAAVSGGDELGVESARPGTKGPLVGEDVSV